MGKPELVLFAHTQKEQEVRMIESTHRDARTKSAHHRSKGGQDAPCIRRGCERDVVDVEPLAREPHPGEDGSELDGVRLGLGPKRMCEEQLPEAGLRRGGVEIVGNDVVVLHRELGLCGCATGCWSCDGGYTM